MILISLVVAGCATKEQIYQSSPSMQTVSTQHYEVKLEPLRAEGYNYYNKFRYQFTNKTNGDLIIDWSETFYLRDGKKYGHFGWIGLTFEELREIKEEPDITIAPGETDSSEIFPLKLMKFCDREFMVPNNPEKYLEIMFGDYMTIPAVEDRKSHAVEIHPTTLCKIMKAKGKI